MFDNIQKSFVPQLSRIADLEDVRVFGKSGFSDKI